MADDNTKIIEADGHTYKLKALGPEDVFDILEAAGDQSTNRGLVAFMAPIFHVQEIDGVPVPSARSLIQARALVKRIGAAGMVAIRAAVDEGGVTEVANEAAAKN